MDAPKTTAQWPADGVGPVGLADALGWGSSVLGAPMTVAPRWFLRSIGVKDDPKAVGWTLAVGVREHLATLNIIANRQRRIGMWSRVMGDTMDLALLAAAHRHKRRDGARLQGAMGIVGGLLALDLYTAVQLTRADGATVKDGGGSQGTGVEHDTGGGPTRVRTAVTIRRPEEEVRAAFRDFGWSAFDPAALEAAGEVRFAAAPGDRGTEIHLDHEPAARGGAVGASAAKIVGRAPDQVIHDELRRLKALLETGVLARSETSPEGPSAHRQIFHKRLPAQPGRKDS
jgi:uncharacterized membrane protein